MEGSFAMQPTGLRLSGTFNFRELQVSLNTRMSLFASTGKQGLYFEHGLIRKNMFNQSNYSYLICVFTMSRYTDKKVTYRPKEDVQVKFGFEYKESAINYRTEIPALPEKPKHKPDEKVRDKKVGDLDGKIKKLKETRNQKKDEIKKLHSEFDGELDHYKQKVLLGKKCILVLEFDISCINEEIGKKTGKINRLQAKVDDHIGQIKDLKFRNRPAKKAKKELDEMSNQELNDQKDRIEQIMMTKDLTKKVETEYSSQLYKIARLKQQVNRAHSEVDQSNQHNGQRIRDLENEVSKIRELENKMKSERIGLIKERDEIEFRIQDIKEDLTDFIGKMKDIAEVVDESTQVQKLIEEGKAIKENINKFKEDIAKVNNDYNEKYKEYETEQQKIKWIDWATKIQEKRRAEWEEEKVDRKRQKLREKGAETKQGVKDAKDGKDDKEGQKGDKPYFEKKKFNKNQKQIDICSFLVDYCKRLYPSEQDIQKQTDKKNVNLNDELKKGQWTREKGIQIITSKKNKNDDEDEPSKTKFNNKKKRQVVKEEEIVPTNRFSHDYFIAQSFDSVKVLPPSNVEELDRIVKDLEDKVEYYLSHPEDNIEQKFHKDKQFVQKNTNSEVNNSKYTKSRGNKVVINKDDFPTL